MSSRAVVLVFWHGISKDINSIGAGCIPCNRNVPSQPSMPAAQPSTPSTPFEMVFANFFQYADCYYLLAGDRLSGCVEVYRSPHGSNKSGAKELYDPSSPRSAYPKNFQVTAAQNLWRMRRNCFWRKGGEPRVSSAYFPQSNGRAEVAVKKCKRLLMENIDPNGSLNNDWFLWALLQMRNSPDVDCKMSPAEIIFGKPFTRNINVRDAFSFINRLPKYTNPSICPTWHDAWNKKEEPMHTRFSRSSERLNRFARQLPPLSVGDYVFVQNQHGSNPTKWDKWEEIITVVGFPTNCETWQQSQYRLN